MKAAILRAPNSKVGIEDRKRPTPGPAELLIRVRACDVCHGDLLLQQGGFPFARFPVVPGHEVAGEIAEVGEGVQWLKPGMRVGRRNTVRAGMGVHRRNQGWRISRIHACLRFLCRSASRHA